MSTESCYLPSADVWIGSAALHSHYVRRIQAFNNRCLCINLGISLWKERRNTSIRAQVQQEHIDTTLMRCRLYFLCHLAGIDDHGVPKQLLLCTPAHGSRPLGEPCLRWNDIVRANLHRLDAENNWCQKAQDHVAMRQEVEDATQTINSERETQEKEAKDENKWRREE